MARNRDDDLPKKKDLAVPMGAGFVRAVTSGDDEEQIPEDESLAEQDMGGEYEITREAQELGFDEDVDGYEVSAKPTAGDDDDEARISEEVEDDLEARKGQRRATARR